MNSHQNTPGGSKMRVLYNELLESWNKNDPGKFSKLFMPDGNVIGFDGSQMNGQAEINNELNRIFSNHTVASFIGIVREVRKIGDNVFVLRAVAGMYPGGSVIINEKVNTIQTLIAQEDQGHLRIAVFQNTPAALHERPDLSVQLTKELQEVLTQKNRLNSTTQ